MTAPKKIYYYKWKKSVKEITYWKRRCAAAEELLSLTKSDQPFLPFMYIWERWDKLRREQPK